MLRLERELTGAERAGQDMEAQDLAPLLLTEREAAKLLNISTFTLARYAKSGAIPRVTIGRLARYDIEDLRIFINQHKTKASTKPKE
jgi:excisionase family DNA binding protein